MTVEHSSSGGRIGAVDGLRGLAVLAVFFNHTLQVPSGGHLGVDMFFALSGFLITSQLLAELDQTGRVDLVNFYWRRCKRLLPAFAVVCALYAVMYLCFPQQVAYASPGTLASLLLVANIYWADGGHVVPFLNHTWSLAVEWQFYLVWPLLLMLLLRLGVQRKTLVVLIVLCVLWMCFARWRGNQLMRYDGILLGALVPLVSGSARMRRLLAGAKAVWLVFVPAALLLVWIFWRGQPVYDVFSKPVVSLLTAILVLFLLKNASRWPSALLDNPVLRHFAMISYGLYLFHFPIAALMYVNGFSPLNMFLVGLLVAVPLAETSWRLLESPILRARLGGRAKGLAPVSR